MRSYSLTNNAKEDLRRIYRWGFDTFGEAQADKYYDDLFQQFEKIALNPLSYPSVDDFRIGYRKCTTKADTIYFRIVGEAVEIAAIIGHQDLENWL